jgi:hypothetical protein
MTWRTIGLSKRGSATELEPAAACADGRGTKRGRLRRVEGRAPLRRSNHCIIWITVGRSVEKRRRRPRRGPPIGV